MFSIIALALALLHPAICAIATAADVTTAIQKLELRVNFKDGSKKASASATYPAVLDKKLSAGPSDSIAVSLSLSGDAEPQTVFLGLANGDSRITFPFEKRDSGYSLKLELESAALKALRRNPGQYQFDVYLSGPSFAPVSHTFGSVEFAFERPADNDVESYHPLREITHVFRAPEKTPNAVISYVFVLVVLAPWVVLLSLWASLGANMGYFTASVSSLIWGSAFAVTLGCSLALFFVYWWSLTLFEFLGYGVFLWIPTAIFGHRALVDRAQQRLQDSKLN